MRRGPAALIWFCVLSPVMSACAPDGLQLADGRQVSRDALDARVLVINHWATWCAPCRHEIPELNQFAQSSDADEVLVFGYGEDFHSGEELLDDIADMGIEFPVFAADPALVWGYGASRVLPRTAIIAPGGEVRQVLLGAQTRRTLREAIENI